MMFEMQKHVSATEVNVTMFWNLKRWMGTMCIKWVNTSTAQLWNSLVGLLLKQMLLAQKSSDGEWLAWIAKTQFPLCVFVEKSHRGIFYQYTLENAAVAISGVSMDCVHQCSNTACLFLRVAIGLLCNVSDKCEIIPESLISALVSVVKDIL